MWNDNDHSNEDTEIRVCRKCWDTFSNCDCEALRLKQALDEAKKEIKELKKLLKSKGSTTVPSTDPWIACGCPNPDDCEHIFRAPTTPPSDAVREAAEAIARRLFGSREHVALWDAINEFREAPNLIAREHAVVRVESGLRAVIAAALAARGGA